MSKRYARQLHSADDLIAAVEQYGFLPFFRNEIHGFSVEELCPPELWFADDVDGPWEWKGPAARSGKCLYGKLFNKKAGFVSREWIPDFANFRRDGYDFDARWDDGLASYKDKELYEAIAGEGRMLSKRLKEALNYRKGGNTGFETCITRLQMQSYVCIADFVYMQDRYGRPYGWGVAEYATPEELFGYDFITSSYQRDPQESKERMMQHLSFTGYCFIKLLVLVGRQTVIPPGVKVIAVTPEVCEVRYPLPAYKASLLVEKFAVETFAAPAYFPFQRQELRLPPSYQSSMDRQDKRSCRSLRPRSS